jgi:hypothetical protein
MTAFQSRREGFAMVTAILAMLVVGVIVTGGFYAASQEGSIAKITDAADMAQFIAETGLSRAVGGTNASTLSGMTVNSTTTLYSSQPATYGGRTVGGYSVSAYRVSRYLFVVKSTGTVTLPGTYNGATRTVAQLLKIRTASFDVGAAVEIFGDMRITGSSDIAGGDSYDPSWTGCTTKTGTSAILGNTNTQITVGGSAVIEGSVTKTHLDSTNFKVFGDFTFSQIAAIADFTFPGSPTVGPGVSYNADGTCKTTDHANWGMPTSNTDTCFPWFPIVYAANGLRISSHGTGQGILLVEGDLDISGGFTYYGAVVVTGNLTMSGTGGHINGTVMAYSGGDFSNVSQTVGNSTAQYSSCAIQRAVLGANALNRPVSTGDRSWIDLTTVQNGY